MIKPLIGSLSGREEPSPHHQRMDEYGELNQGVGSGRSEDEEDEEEDASWNTCGSEVSV